MVEIIINTLEVIFILYYPNLGFFLQKLDTDIVLITLICE